MAMTSAESYQVAQNIAELANDQQWEAVSAMLGAYVGDDRQTIMRKAIALGVDGDILRDLVGRLDASGETIEIIDTRPTMTPKLKPAHKLLGAAAAVGLGLGLFAHALKLRM